MESKTQTQIATQPSRNIIQRISIFLFTPHESITDIAGRRRAQLSSTLALVLALTLGLSLYFVGRNGINMTFFIQVFLTATSFVAYWLSRLPRFIWGSILLVFSLSISGFANILGGSDNPANALYTTLPIAFVLGSTLLPVWVNLIQYIGILAIIAVLPLVYSPFTYQIVGESAAIILPIGLFLIVAQVFRDGIERERLAEEQAVSQQLRELGITLEQRVSDRTRDLEIVAEVGTAAATITELNRLLQAVVDLTKERFNLYHAHIYLLDEKGENLVLTAGAGEPGRIMTAQRRSIPLDREQSLVARAARERQGVTVNDVTQSPDFLPNPLLPNTRSELAVPMIVGGNVVGVFDIQSDRIGRFTEADINIQTTLAAQVATSIQNVRVFEESRRQAELESMVNVIGQRIQQSATIEETLQTAIRELGAAIGAKRVKASIQPASGSASNEVAFAEEQSENAQKYQSL